MKKSVQKSSIHHSTDQFHPNFLLVAIPSRGMVSCEFVSSLLIQDNPLNMSLRYRFELGGEVGKSRNALITYAKKMGAEYTLFLDDDVILPPDCFNKLVYWANKGYEIVSGVYYSKQIPPQPLIFKGRGNGYVSNWKVGDIIKDADGIGMGMALIKMSVFDEIPKPWFLSVVKEKNKKNNTFVSIDESLYFCDKLKQAGKKILVDTSIQGIHFDSKNKIYYFNSQEEPCAVKGDTVLKVRPKDNEE